MRIILTPALLLGLALLNNLASGPAVGQILGDQRYGSAANGQGPLSTEGRLQPVSPNPPTVDLYDDGESIAEGELWPQTLPPPRGPADPAPLPHRGAAAASQEPGASGLPADADRTAPTATPAKEWLETVLRPPPGAALVGESLSLAQAMQGSYGRDRHIDIVTAYWQLAVDVAKYHVVYLEVHGPNARDDVATARGASDAGRQIGLLEARLNAVRSQHKLAQVLQWEPDRLPLPTSPPHAGSYKTRYEEIFAGRVSRRARELDQTLPLLYEMMKLRAESLQTARSDSRDFRPLAFSFLDVVGQYNLAIAEYAVLAAGDSLSGRELVPLLIRSQGSQEHIASPASLGRTSRLDVPARGRTPGGAILDSQVRQVTGEAPPPATLRTDQWRRASATLNDHATFSREAQQNPFSREAQHDPFSREAQR